MESIRKEYPYLADRFSMLRMQFAKNNYPEYLQTFENFYKFAMSIGYKKGLYINKIDFQGGYTTDNLHVTEKRQKNKRKPKEKKYKPIERDTIREWLPRKIKRYGNTTISSKHYKELGRYGIYKLCGKCHISKWQLEDGEINYYIERCVDGY